MIIQVRTRNTTYLIELQGDKEAIIQGSTEFCPLPTHVEIVSVIAVGVRLQFRYKHLQHGAATNGNSVTTTPVESIIIA